MELSKQQTTDYLTYTREVDVLLPKTFQPCMEEVFVALPKINRFNGQTSFPYSVAQHSLCCLAVGVSEHGLTEPHQRMAVLLHDAAEAYIGDIVRPIKHKFNSGLVHVEQEILVKLLRVAGLDDDEMVEVCSEPFISIMKEIDTRMALTELLALRHPTAWPREIGDFEPYMDVVIGDKKWAAVENTLRATYQHTMGALEYAHEYDWIKEKEKENEALFNIRRSESAGAGTCSAVQETL